MISMRLKVAKLMDGPGPGEALVGVATIDGRTEEVIVHHMSIEDGTIEIGHPIHRQNDRALVELPQEAMSGKWRVWVPVSAVA